MRILFELFSAICLTAASTECFRTLQSVGYRPNRGYFRIYFSVYFAVLAVVQAASTLLELFVPYALYINAALYLIVASVWCALPRKTPLRLTKRMCRMLAVQCLLLCALCLTISCSYWVWLLPLATLASWACCLPLDAAINAAYLRKASAKLAASGITVVAVTGSYGKTSVKDMLSALLNDSLCAQGSCNTPLGIAAFINRTDLSGAKYLVLEFGARCKGDIARLCKLYKPLGGVVTGICRQHLSTFGTMERIIATKRELTENLPQQGFCVLNGNDPLVAGFADSGVCSKRLSYDGLQIDVEAVDFDGTQLLVTADGASYPIRLPQIGSYLADNLALCLQTALALGQTLPQTMANAVNVRQTPHRMQLMEGARCHIIDDSYNGSEMGVRSCAQTLARFCCPKVVITQGLVECGKQRRRLNEQCGKVLGEVCDAAVVLGKNAKYLAQGLSQTGCRVLYADTLRQAVGLAVPLAQDGILLFQNDLPDIAGA